MTQNVRERFFICVIFAPLLVACPQETFPPTDSDKIQLEEDASGADEAPESTGGGSSDVEPNPTDDPDTPDIDEGESAESCEPISPTLRRLNRTEYDNTIRDLTGLELALGQDFPNDDYGYGFDNIGEVLSVSPLLVEKWESAAETIINSIFAASVIRTTQTFEAEELGSSVGGATAVGWNLWANGAISSVVQLEAAGTYRIRVRAFGMQAGDEPARMAISVDGTQIAVVDVTATAGNFQIYAVNVSRPAGPASIEIAFINDYYVPNVGDRNLIIDYFEVDGPLEPATPTDAANYQALMICDPNEVAATTTATLQEAEDQCARTIFSAFGKRAWRRPLTEAELTRLGTFLELTRDEGEGFAEGVQLGLRAILLSPHFVYRIELDDGIANNEVRSLNGYELATRLSYFLWSSMPDDALFEKAADGRLLDPDQLAQEVGRMLNDPRADAFVENFVGQWLFTRGIYDAFPDIVSFPMWDDGLRTAMEQETTLVVKELLREERSLLDLLDADFTYLNERLASHYGIDGIVGDDMQRVAMPSQSERRGFLSHGSFLTTTSHPNRTSPVKRGKLILEQLLCIAPPPPPPGVEGLPEEVDPTASLRERFEQHRQDPNCMSCHELMDPFGFALENFDGVGAWRDTDHGFDIDASGMYMGVTHFDGYQELAQLMKNDPLVPDCISQKSLTYALGRGLDVEDVCTVGQVHSSFAADGFTLKGLLRAIAESDAFQKRRREVESP